MSDIPEPIPINKKDGNVKFIRPSFLSNFANFIRSRLDTSPNMLPSEMPNYIHRMNIQFVNPEGVFSVTDFNNFCINGNNFNQLGSGTEVITGLYCGDNVNYLITPGVFSDLRSNLYAKPVCGHNVTNMENAYRNCRNLTGSPVCGPNVINMLGTYMNCRNLTGSPVCGPKVTDMLYAYANCYNLTGSPVCGPNVTDMSDAYYYCVNLTGSPVCGPNVIVMLSTYYNCRNLTGSPVCGPKVTDMLYTYANCYNLTGSPVCGPKVTDMLYAYANCYNLTGSPVCGPNVTGMSDAYYYCVNLTGSPVCGPNVTNMLQTYDNCRNLTGSPVIGPAVTNADSAYANCSNLSGSIKIPSTATHLNHVFANTRNISSVYITGSRTNANLVNAFNRAAVLAELNEGETLPRMNIIFSTGGANLLNNVKIASVTGCTMTAVATVSGDDANIEFPWTYGNGEVYFRNNVTVKRGCYNVLHNIYMYTVN